MIKEFKTIVWVIAAFLLLAVQGLATHNRAGQITYTHVSGTTYEITILTCTDISSPNNADRPYMPIDWGDGSAADSIQRVGNGTVVIPFVAKENRYVKQHTFPGPGTYALYTEDPNRNGGVNNIPNSIDVIFSVTTVLVISPNTSAGSFNNSVQLLNPPKDDACINALWLHNPAAVDPDGDSLYYELIPCTGAGGNTIIGYVFPDDFPAVGGGQNGVISINPNTGTVTWDSPMFAGEYNIAIRINEYRNGYFVGSVLRDMQITVFACNNQPPTIQPLQDMCIIVGTTGSQAITAFDPNNDSMDLEMFGETFELTLTPSTFTQTNSFNPAMGTFLWSPSCSQIQVNPYTAFVKAIDISNQGTDLSDIDFFQIRVIAQAVENLLTDVQQGGDIILSWDMASCDNASGYKVYRRIGSSIFTPGPCITGLPASAGYDLVSTIEGNTILTYLDTNVPYGSEVCYRIVACFPDGAQSIVSDEVCDRIERVKPAITQATVDITDLSIGQTTIRWAAPLDLDTLNIFTGPYSYQISRSIENGPFVGIGNTIATAVMNVPQEDLLFIDSGLNTIDEQISYKVEFLNDGSAVSLSTAATTVYMTLIPLDNRVLIEWNEEVPWINDSYDVFTVDPTTGAQTFLINVSASPYEHLGLTNGIEYCYVIKSYGMYDPSSGLVMSIENYSQESCTRPIDLEAPCAPFLSFDGTCIEEDYTLNWIVDGQPCNDDVTAYNIYYAENDTAEYVFLTQIAESNTFSYIPPQEYAVGCMVITALDSLLIQPDGTVTQNESPFSESICLESCPTYELPNVISPNGDGLNDIFMPFEPYRYVDSVDFQIFNRWGQLVFETHDPAIQWKGDNKDSGEQVSDGVYFYTIVIHEKRLQGITPRNEAGNIQVLDNRGFNNK
jgi:gliding motility-associated-like protein